ncbi:MAG: hypothetical protein AB7D37_12275 [Desulfovibrio sp.]
MISNAVTLVFDKMNDLFKQALDGIFNEKESDNEEARQQLKSITP